MKRACIFWNLQRLFEPNGNEIAKNLGISNQNWNDSDYQCKIENIAACLQRITDGAPPAILAFAEVETLRIVKDIVKIAGWNDLISMDETVPAPELKGHDISVLFDKTIFEEKPVQARSITLNNNFSTRDLIRLRLKVIKSGMEMEVFIAHWPSRTIGEGEILRMSNSFYLRNLIQEQLKFSKAELMNNSGNYVMPDTDILVHKWNTPCIIMGDFNDEPYNNSIREALGSTRNLQTVLGRGKLSGTALKDATKYLASIFTLYNPCWDMLFRDTRQIGGSFYRSPDWRTYDQLMVTHGLLQENSPIRLVQASVTIPRLDRFEYANRFISMTTKSGFPNEFVNGKTEGVSDHFPIYFELEIAH